MSACRYCQYEVIWIPKAGGSVLPFDMIMVPPDTTRVILTRHECEEREEFIKSIQNDFAQRMMHDPQVSQEAFQIVCTTCGAGVDASCQDQRKGFRGRLTSNPHKPRLEEALRRIQEREGPIQRRSNT